MSLTRFSIDVDGIHIEGEGVVTITGAPQPDVDVGQTLAQLVRQLDPAELERAALKRQEWGSGVASLTADILAVIADLATGTPDGS